MRETEQGILYSASDLVNFLGCRHATFLDLRQLVEPVEIEEEPEAHDLLQQKGLEHERRYLETLRAQGRQIVEIDDKSGLDAKVAATAAAMEAGVEVIYQGVLRDNAWHGYADFLLRKNGVASRLGDFVYEIADTKLARTAKPKHAIQLCVYADLVARFQGVLPPHLHIVLGTNETVTLRSDDFIHYYAAARDRLVEYVAAPPAKSEPERCAHCEFCRWLPRCEKRWGEIDHLNQVANIGRGHIESLVAGGIRTLEGLARLPSSAKIQGVPTETLARLRAQAGLQLHKRTTGEDRLEVLPRTEGRGYDRLPKPDPGDIFFDIEGDPLFDGGLEYLFGFVHLDGGPEIFTPFWAHDRAEEKAAFEKAIDFIASRLERHPGAHVYHYAAYEATAIKTLAMRHATREFAVDQLLRKGKLVDLYKVVREGVRVSEPGYSIKNLEAFYWKGKRTGGVTNAGESVVIYERWRKLRDDKLLEEIRRYNEVDCHSTRACRDWLLGHRPAEAVWFTGPRVSPEDAVKEAERREAETRARAAVDRLTKGAPVEEFGWRETLGHLLEFHRRAAKPGWWATFERADMEEEELIEDAECLGGITRVKGIPPKAVKRSLVYRFAFPPQDTKLRVGSDALRNDTLRPTGEIVALDAAEGLLELKLAATRAPPPDQFSLIPGGPIRDQIIREAVGRCADSVATGSGAYRAVVDLLRKSSPRLTGRSEGAPIIKPTQELLTGTIDAIRALDDSYLVIQGPPGTGKTYTSARAIVALLATRKTVGVSSNSHKAINNLLREIEAVAKEKCVSFRGVKKSTDEDDCLDSGGQIKDVFDNEEVEDGDAQLIAGTAWLLAREAFDRRLDYLFIDEAGQVSLANVVAMGTSARNLVLVGDPMQLAQPIQGVHPGESGLSALQYAMHGHTTVAPERGIFLGITRRMHTDVCRFVSDAFYEGRLAPDAAAARQRVVLSSTLEAAGVPATGIRFVPVIHTGCSQKSAAEAERLAELYGALLGEHWIDRDGGRRVIGTDDILVVSPYNMQVALLSDALPAGARVGTVDKFQGQEAAVVLVSMTTSSAEEIPRGVEFLFSRNRLNVAVSRARCLAVEFASPKLFEVPCSTIEQMALVDTFCRLDVDCRN